MDNISKYILVSFLIVILIGCEKTEIIDESNDPVFMADLSIVNEGDLNIVAGDDEYYMYASSIEGDDETILKGLFGKLESCTSECVQNLEISLHQRANGIGDIKTGTYDFYTIPKNGFKHNYSLVSDNTENDLVNSSWKVGDQTLFGDSIQLNADNDDVLGEGVRLLYDNKESFVVQMDRKILPKEVNCSIELLIEREGDDIFLEIKTGAPFQLVNWSTGETGARIKTDENISTYSAFVFDANGCQTNVFVHLKTRDIQESSVIGFMEESIAFDSPDNADHTVSISYVDEEGVFYTTSVIGQILPFDFEVESVEDYEINEIGLPTKKIKANFSCILFGENGKTKRISNGDVIFAVAH